MRPPSSLAEARAKRAVGAAMFTEELTAALLDVLGAELFGRIRTERDCEAHEEAYRLIAQEDSLRARRAKVALWMYPPRQGEASPEAPTPSSPEVDADEDEAALAQVIGKRLPMDAPIKKIEAAVYGFAPKDGHERCRLVLPALFALMARRRESARAGAL